MCALEAMALGVPVVSTPSDGMRDLIEDGINGYLHDKDEVLVEKLLQIIRDPGHRAMLSRNTQEKFARINDAAKYQEAIAACYR